MSRWVGGFEYFIVQCDNGMFSGGKDLARVGAGLEVQSKLRKALKEVAEVAERLEGGG